MYHVYRPVFAARLAARELNRECVWGELSRALLGPYGENRGGFAECPCTCTRLPASNCYRGLRQHCGSPPLSVINEGWAMRYTAHKVVETI